MELARCPHCSTPASAGTMIDGKCINCGYEGPTHVATEPPARTGRRNDSGEDR